jgi:hypothetical protein
MHAGKNRGIMITLEKTYCRKRAVPPEDGSTLPGPALVEPEVCAAVQEQWRENKRPARHQSRRGAL